VKILHVDSARTWRGGQNQVMLSARGMAERGHDVLVACQQGGALFERLSGSGLAAAPIRFGGDLSVTAALSLRRTIHGFRPDVVHAHDPHALAASLPTPLPRRIASRRVDFALKGGPSRWKYLRCARVVAVSRAVRDVLEAGRLPADRLRLVYEGVPDRPPQSGGRAALLELGIPETAAVVGNVAALTGHKDHETFLRAAALVVPHMPTVRFVIVGDGERRSTLLALAASLGLSSHVVFAGFRTDLDRLIPAFDVFCLSSHMEGLGTSVLDAMCFGVPVVATAAGGLPEVVEDEVSGRVVPVRDPAALAAALREVAGDAALRARLGAASRAAFVARFTASRMVESTLAVYEELA
jgi:L-malate glycosyltransferase